MSYSTARRSLGSTVSVGARAYVDPILASASLDAARTMLARAQAGSPPTQAAFDSLRLSIANRRMDESIAQLRRNSSSGLSGFSPNDRATACAITSGVQTVGTVAQVVPVYGPIVGLVTGIGGSVASNALDCTREQREAQAAQAAQEARLAAATLAAASATATAEAAARRRRMKTYAMGGGLALAALAVTWIVLK